MKPVYNLEKLKFAVDGVTFEKAVAIYEKGKISNFRGEIDGFFANVGGSQGQNYSVFVSAKNHDRGGCDCYLGKNDELCKHMVAVAIWAVTGGEKLSEKDKQAVGIVSTSGKLGELSKEELSLTKKQITEAMRYIKAYNGPSRTWFKYQNSLDEGCARLSALISELPVSEQIARLLVALLVRLDEKLSRGGVDDSNGTVGGFMEEVVNVLVEYAKLDQHCLKAFESLKSIESCFGWEVPLLEALDH